jgi:hypothetical protein
LQLSRLVLVGSIALTPFLLLVHAQGKELPMEQPAFYRTIQVDGFSIFGLMSTPF